MLAHCSKARLFEELLKILQKPFTDPTFAALHKYGALAALLPAMDAHWGSKEGTVTRKLLAVRDSRLAAGNYSKSRALGLATTAFAFVARQLDTPAGELFEYTPGIERSLKDAIFEFFAPLPLPRLLTARTRDVLLLLPRFRQTHGRNKLIGHPEFRYARELYSILTVVYGWDPAVIEGWPEMGTGHPYRNRQDRRRKSRRRRPRGNGKRSRES